MEPSWLQIALGTLTLMTALWVVISRNPIVSAVMLMATLFLTGGLYFSQNAYFIGAVQILIYAGAISVLFIFIVMLLDLKPGFVAVPGRKATLALALMVAILMLVSLLPAVMPTLVDAPGLQTPVIEPEAAEAAVESGTATITAFLPSSGKAISLLFLTKYMIPFQATGLLILAAVMGVTVLGKQNTQQKDDA